MEQELIEYTYDHDVLDLANLETSSIFAMELLESQAGETGEDNQKLLALFC